jgi:4-amino-4-deoxy-L-arabinose transferase-like glycosyltransferase
MIDSYVFIIWPILIGGALIAFWWRKKQTKKSNALLFAIGFLLVSLILFRIVFGAFWFEILFFPNWPQ